MKLVCTECVFGEKKFIEKIKRFVDGMEFDFEFYTLIEI
jgi:hypothetical protein